MDKLKEFIPNFLIQTSILCGVFPLKSNSLNNVFLIYSIVLLIASLLTFTLMIFLTSCLTCQLNTKKITFSIWFHILKVVYPTLRIFSYVPSYYTAIFLLKKYLFNIIYNICISDSILKNTNHDIKKKHFFLMYLFSISMLLPSTLLKLNILYSALCSVLMEGGIWRMGFFINIYLGDTSMTCAELQFICFCSCLGYRYKWINETLDCIMKHIDSELQNTYPMQSKDAIKNCLLLNSSKKISLYLNMKKNLLRFFKKFVHKRSTSNMNLHKTHKNALKNKRYFQNQVITSKNKFLRSVKSRKVNVLNYISGSDDCIKENYNKFTLEANYISKSVQINKLKNIGKLSSKISQLRAAHHFLHKAAFLLEVLYRILITSSVITLFALALLYAYFELLHFDQHGLSYVQYSRYLVFVWIYHFIGRIYLILTQAHYAAQEATYTASLLTQIDCRQLDPDSRFEVGINYLQLKLFLNDIRSKELSFSMWGFFSLTPNLITIVVSAVTTYLAILVQFSEKK